MAVVAETRAEILGPIQGLKMDKLREIVDGVRVRSVFGEKVGANPTSKHKDNGEPKTRHVRNQFGEHDELYTETSHNGDHASWHAPRTILERRSSRNGGQDQTTIQSGRDQWDVSSAIVVVSEETNSAYFVAPYGNNNHVDAVRWEIGGPEVASIQVSRDSRHVDTPVLVKAALNAKALAEERQA